MTVGVTDFAQEQLGDVVFLDLPDIDETVEASWSLWERSSPPSRFRTSTWPTGKVAEINVEAKDNPAAVNQDPYGEGWLLVIEPAYSAEFQGLLSPDQYERFLEEEAGEGEAT